VELAAKESSINPRLLLALVEYRSGWLTKVNPDPALDNNLLASRMLGFTDCTVNWSGRSSNSAKATIAGAPLQSQLVLADGSVVPIDPTINAGTAGVQNFFAQLDDYSPGCGTYPRVDFMIPTTSFWFPF